MNLTRFLSNRVLFALAVAAVATLIPVSAIADSHKGKDIVDTAASAGSFNTLVTALQKAGLVETLKGEGPFTVFAPNDKAFAKIPPAQLNALLADKEKLTSVLTYHVVPGKVMAADVAGLTSAKSVQGQELRIDTSDGVKVNDAKVIKTDIATSNGVIHVIDTVIMPKGVSGGASPAAGGMPRY
jgi:uncharacterized surface protein with fasciclin (FAS1) repeats